MSSLVRAELLKLRTTRLLFGIGLTTLGLTLLSTLLSILSGHLDEKPVDELLRLERDALANGAIASLFVFVMALSSTTSEFRFGTITPTVLAVPDRGRMLAGKGIACALMAAAVALTAILLGILVGLPAISGANVGLELSGADFARVILGGVVAAILMALFGMGLGAALRSTVAVLIGIIALILFIQPLVDSLLFNIDDYMPLDAAAKTAGVSGGDVSQVASGLILAGYAGVACFAGVFLARLRDVT